MLELIVRVTCDRCAASEELKEEYRRKFEDQIINKVRHELFHGAPEDEGRQLWRELTGDVRHLCPQCNRSLKKLNTIRNKMFDDWVEEGKYEVV